MSEEPFVRLSRGFFDHPFWDEEREYSRAEAWLDLVRSVSWRGRETVVKGSIVKVLRGGIVASERFLSGRWKWSRTKVRAFLDLLEGEKMVRREKDHENTIIYLCNFEKYNPGKDHGKTSEEPLKDQIEEGKEENQQGGGARKLVILPTLDQAIAYAPMAGVNPKAAEVWWLECDSRPLTATGHFTDARGNAIHRWQSALTSYGRKWVDYDERNGRTAPAGKPGKPTDKRTL